MIGVTLIAFQSKKKVHLHQQKSMKKKNIVTNSKKGTMNNNKKKTIEMNPNNKRYRKKNSEKKCLREKERKRVALLKCAFSLRDVTAASTAAASAEVQAAEKIATQQKF